MEEEKVRMEGEVVRRVREAEGRVRREVDEEMVRKVEEEKVKMEGEVVRRVREAEGRVREEWASDLGRLRKNFQVETQD